MNSQSEAETLAAAKRGDADAIETLLESVRDHVYRLSLRMLTYPADAEDATQEILLRGLTRLSTFRGEANFSTWVHRIAVNYLIDHKRTQPEEMGLNFDIYAQDLVTGLAAPQNRSAPEVELLAQEVKLGCTQAMLVCLDRDLRVVYVLGEVFEVSSDDGAYICEVSSATYRKRLSRARSKIRSFMGNNCGLVSPETASCRCNLRIDTAVSLGRIDAINPAFSKHLASTDRATPRSPVSAGMIESATGDMEDLATAATLMRSHPDYRAPEQLAERISSLIGSGQFGLLSTDLQP